MAKKFATGNSGRLFKDLEISELKEQNIILERQGEREEERFYENRIYQIKLQMAQATDEQQLVLLEEMLSQEIANLEEVKERNSQNEKRRRMMYFIPFILVFLLFVVGALYILFTPSKKNNEDKIAILNNSSNAVSSTSTSSTKQASLGGNKSQDKQTSSTSSAPSRPQPTKVYIGSYIGQKSSDVIDDLKSRNIPENHIKVEEEESDEYSPGTVLHQSLSEGTLYDLNDASGIILTVAKKRTSATMPSYIGSSLEFTKNNLKQIVGVKEANIEVVEVSTAPEGTVEGTVVEQNPKVGENVDLNKIRIKISIYKPKAHQISQSRSR
ncbi:Serine/threonine protein kinase PrkC, regulator of stationary phase [Streptococcus oralis]|uniref:Serine/threonine protein kinase PrkC, regulator of stationary phase n=1 Tax=Streptococcus oralis TaxID=1303 RepID=A0A139PFL0_STROR|nr:Serine/threonine protein kinase PrkC, regulator of stationary phase [Streptococcus oralis]